MVNTLNPYTREDIAFVTAMLRIKQQSTRAHQQSPVKPKSQVDPLAMKLQILLGPALKRVSQIPEGTDKHTAGLAYISLTNAKIDREHAREYLRESILKTSSIKNQIIKIKLYNSIAKTYIKINSIKEADQLLQNTKKHLIESQPLDFTSLKDLITIAKIEAKFNLTQAAETLKQIKSLVDQMSSSVEHIPSLCFQTEVLAHMAQLQTDLGMKKEAQETIGHAWQAENIAYQELISDQEQLFVTHEKIQEFKKSLTSMETDEILFCGLTETKEIFNQFIQSIQMKYNYPRRSINSTDLENGVRIERLLRNLIDKNKILLVFSLTELAKLTLVESGSAIALLNQGLSLARTLQDSSTSEKAGCIEIVGRAMVPLDVKEATLILQEALEYACQMDDEYWGKWLILKSITLALANLHKKDVNESMLQFILCNKTHPQYAESIAAMKVALDPIKDAEKKNAILQKILNEIRHSNHDKACQSLVIQKAKNGESKAALDSAELVSDPYEKVRAIGKMCIHLKLN